MRNAFNRDHYRIIVSYCYRDNFDLSYRLSIENSIWHIVTALTADISEYTVGTENVVIIRIIIFILGERVSPTPSQDSSPCGFRRYNWHEPILLTHDAV